MTVTKIVPTLLELSSERPPVWHEFVDNLIEDGFLWDGTRAEWVRPADGKRGRVSWNDERAWLNEPTYEPDDYSPAASAQRAGARGSAGGEPTTTRRWSDAYFDGKAKAARDAKRLTYEELRARGVPDTPGHLGIVITEVPEPSSSYALEDWLGPL